MQFRHPESYRILSDGRILQDPMGSGVGYVGLGFIKNIKNKFSKTWHLIPTFHATKNKNKNSRI